MRFPWNSESFEDDGSFLSFYCNDLKSAFLFPENVDRKHPFAPYYPMKVTQTIEVRLPKEIEKEKELKEIQDEAFNFTTSWNTEEKTCVLECFYRAVKDHVQPERMQEFHDNLNNAWKNSGVCINKEILDGKWNTDSPASADSPNWFSRTFDYGADEPNRIKRFFKRLFLYCCLGSLLKGFLFGMGWWPIPTKQKMKPQKIERQNVQKEDKPLKEALSKLNKYQDRKAKEYFKSK